jgi:hypothetical protein
LRLEGHGKFLAKNNISHLKFFIFPHLFELRGGMNKKTIILTVLLTLVTLASLASKYAYIDNTEIIAPIRADARQYVQYGSNLYKHGVFSQQQSPNPEPDSFRSPGFPLLVALAFHLGGVKKFYILTLLFQAVLTSLLVPLSYTLARTVLPGIWSFVVCILVAFSPHLMSISSYLLTESLFSFLFLTAITCYIYGSKNSNKTLLIVSGIFFGLSYLTNEIVLFIPFILAGLTGIIHIAAKPRTKGFEPVKIVALSLIIFSLFPLGWSIRNSLYVTDFSKKGANRALNTLTHGTYPDFVYKNPRMKYFPYREDPEQPEYSSSFNSFITIFTKRVKERPLRYLSWYILEKPYWLWTWNIMQGQGDIYIYKVKSSLFTKYPMANKAKGLLKIIHALVQFSLIAGLVTLFFPQNRLRSNHTLYALISVFAYLTLIYAIFVPWPRYAIPFRPLFYTLGVWSFYSVFLLTKNIFHTRLTSR